MRPSARRAVDAEDASIVYAGLYGALRTPEQVIEDVLAIEGELLAGVAYHRRDREDVMDIEKRLSALGLALPAPPTPAGNYIGSCA